MTNIKQGDFVIYRDDNDKENYGCIFKVASMDESGQCAKLEGVNLVAPISKLVKISLER